MTHSKRTHTTDASVTGNGGNREGGQQEKKDERSKRGRAESNAEQSLTIVIFSSQQSEGKHCLFTRRYTMPPLLYVMDSSSFPGESYRENVPPVHQHDWESKPHTHSSKSLLITHPAVCGLSHTHHHPNSESNESPQKLQGDLLERFFFFPAFPVLLLLSSSI